MRRFRLLFVFLLCIPAHFTLAQSTNNSHLNFIGFGDWGIDTPEHKQVAETMAAFSTKSTPKIDCALSLGDNFYIPITSGNDPQFTALFEKSYDPARMSFPFYIVPGNHDYETLNGHTRWEWEVEYAKLHPDSRWKMPSRWYRLDLPADHPLVTLLMLDSDKDNAGKYPNLTAQEWTDELAWLKTQLAGPRAAWTICCAHHTIYSNGKSGNNGVLMEQWGSLFQQYKVDFYLCGHNHSMEHLERNVFTSFVISGGGGAKQDAMLYDQAGPYSRSISGFASFAITPDKTTVTLLAGDGQVLHTFERTKAGAMNITFSTPSEPRTTQPLKLIQGFDVPPTPVGPAIAPAK